MRRPTTYARIFAWVAATCALLSLVATAWLAVRASQIRSHLSEAMEAGIELKNHATQGREQEASQALRELEVRVARAREFATDPLWRFAGSVPVIGPNFSAVTEVAVAGDDTIGRAVKPLLNLVDAQTLSDLAPSSGRINVDTLEAIAPRILTAAQTTQLSHSRLEAIDRGPLLPEVAEPLDQVTDILSEANSALTGAASAATVLPNMLGAEEQRNYLILVQNNSEIRATGGIPGALAVIRSVEGEIELTGQASATEMGAFEPAIEVDPAQSLIFSDRMGTFMQSVNLTPNFPTAAATAATMWDRRFEGPSIDGVVALDPIALSHIIQVTGPVSLNFQDQRIEELLSRSGLPTSLTAENVVPTLLSDVYAAIEDPTLQDAYFAAVASEIFNELSSGTHGFELVKALLRGTEEGRIFVWSADPAEQRVIETTSLSGSITGANSGGAAFGAYFNDGTGAKMDYYVTRTVQLSRRCVGESYYQFTLTATLTNNAPADAADSLPLYVTGGGVTGVSPGSVQTNFVGYGPGQALLQTARINGASAPLGSYRHGDRPVGVLTSSLAPGETAVLELDFTNVVQTSEPVLDVTPTVQPTSEVILPLKNGSRCS